MVDVADSSESRGATEVTEQPSGSPLPRWMITLASVTIRPDRSGKYSAAASIRCSAPIRPR